MRSLFLFVKLFFTFSFKNILQNFLKIVKKSKKYSSFIFFKGCLLENKFCLRIRQRFCVDSNSTPVLFVFSKNSRILIFELVVNKYKIEVFEVRKKTFINMYTQHPYPPTKHINQIFKNCFQKNFILYF